MHLTRPQRRHAGMQTFIVVDVVDVVQTTTIHNSATDKNAMKRGFFVFSIFVLLRFLSQMHIVVDVRIQREFMILAV